MQKKVITIWVSLGIWHFPTEKLYCFDELFQSHLEDLTNGDLSSMDSVSQKLHSQM